MPQMPPPLRAVLALRSTAQDGRAVAGACMLLNPVLAAIGTTGPGVGPLSALKFARGFTDAVAAGVVRFVQAEAAGGSTGSDGPPLDSPWRAAAQLTLHLTVLRCIQQKDLPAFAARYAANRDLIEALAAVVSLAVGRRVNGSCTAAIEVAHGINIHADHPLGRGATDPHRYPQL